VRIRKVVTSIVVAVFVLTLAACTPRIELADSTPLVAGQSVLLQPDIGLVIAIDGPAIVGQGELRASEISRQDGLRGWSISLDGATLNEPMRLTFLPGADDSEPAPLVAFASELESNLQPVSLTESPNGWVASSTQPGIWFVMRWSEVAAASAERMQTAISATPVGEEVTCSGAKAAKKSGDAATSSGATIALWCLGEDASKLLILKLGNATGIPLTVDMPRGMRPHSKDKGVVADVVKAFPELLAEPSTENGHVRMLGAAASMSFDVLGATDQYVSATPRAGGFVTAAILEGAAIRQSLWPFDGDGDVVDSDFFSELAATQCLSGVTSSADPTTADEAQNLYSRATAAVISCIPQAIDGDGAAPVYDAAVLSAGLDWLAAQVAKGSADVDAPVSPTAFVLTVEPKTPRQEAVNASKYLGYDYGASKSYEFDSPSRNLHCAIFTPARASEFQFGCNVEKRSFADPASTKKCTEVKFNGTFMATGGGYVQPICQGGAIFGGEAGGSAVLPYGKSITVGEITCESQATGMTCYSREVNTGFTVAGNAYIVY
jgi:hypothetical protein